MKINSNITALMTMTHMNKATNNASSAIGRLSSGFKINKASDSPAGWAIATQIEGQANGLNQANRNAMDAISLVQTTEGALNEINSMLNRIRDLCVEAVNDTNTGGDRQNMQDEINELIAEINSITQRTDFNGIKMLNNSQNITIQTGANAYEMLEISGERTSMSGVLSTLVDFDVMKVQDHEMVIELKEVTKKEYEVDENDIEYIQFILDKGNEETTNIINNPDFSNKEKNEKVIETKKKMIENIHEYIHPQLKEDVNGNPILITAEDGKVNQLLLDIEETIYPRNDSNDPKPDPTANADTKLATITSLITDYHNRRFEEVKKEVTAIRNKYVTNEDKMSETLVGEVTDVLNRSDAAYAGDNKISDVDTFLEEITKVIQKEEVNEKDVLENAINKIDACVTQVTDIRSMLGAYQNRLEAIVANLGVSEENTTEALSRIRDADMAEEMTEYTLQNVIAQAGISMLSQANQRPQQILQLLAQ